MGRLAGFLGGAVLTTAVVYLTTVQMRRDFFRNSSVLQESRRVMDSLHHPPETVKPLRAFIARPSFVETVKDTWNHEIEKNVRWVQGIDSVKIRENAERMASNVWRRINNGRDS